MVRKADAHICRTATAREYLRRDLEGFVEAISRVVSLFDRYYLHLGQPTPELSAETEATVFATSDSADMATLSDD